MGDGYAHHFLYIPVLYLSEVSLKYYNTIRSDFLTVLPSLEAEVITVCLPL